MMEFRGCDKCRRAWLSEWE